MRRRVILAGVVIGIGHAVAAWAQPTGQPASVTLPTSLARVLRDYEAGWKAKDGKALALLFTEDGFAMSADRPPVRGRAAIEQQYSKTAGGDLRLRALEFATADSVGYIVGGYSYPPNVNDVGKFVLALKRDSSGRWLIAADIDNSNGR